jgi:hypothetical protein
LLVAASYLPFWNLRTTLGLGVFGLLLVVIALALSIKLDSLTLARRQRRGRRLILNRPGAYARLVKFILGGVLVPVAVLLAANRITLPGQKTPMELAIEAGTATPVASDTERLAAAVLRAGAAPTKVAGIAALQAVHTPEALEQLLRILGDDPEALRDDEVRVALTKALASFGATAVPQLAERLNGIATGERRTAAEAPGDLFERCFAAPFAALAAEVAASEADAAARADASARLQAAAAELRRAVVEVNASALPAPAATALPAFLMGVFLAMELRHDAALLELGRSVAADAGWSDAVRGQALLLIAKVGGQSDLAVLYAHLDDRGPLLPLRALQAIAALQTRLAVPPAR